MDNKSNSLPLSGSVGGSSRAKQMLAMATGGKAGRPAGGGGGRTPGSQVVVLSRKPKQPHAPKREAEDGPLLEGLHATPKKQRTPAGGPGATPTSAPSAPRPPTSLGPARALPLAPPAPRASRGAATCTQLRSCYEDRLWLRERQQESEELRQRISSGGGASFRRGGGMRPSLGALPAGMLNLGNTCYLNAVLQVLLSLPSFVADLRRGQQQLEVAGQPLSGKGLYAALLECVAARDARLDRHIRPASLKRALDASSSAFRGTFQQDAHELFVALLEGVQREVLAREVGRLGRSRVRVSETADPAARNFSLAVQHELTCSRCRHASSLVEEYMHLSLELPEAQPGSVAACSLAELLRRYFREEVVEKSCEGCGGANLPHALRHRIRRLPRVLVLHMKRFQVSWSPEQQQAVCQKLHTQVAVADRVQLGPFLAAGAAPPLPGGQQQEAGKENEQLGANAASGAGATAAESGQGKGLLLRRSGAAFYGGGGATTPVASSALLSPAAMNSPLLRGRQATPGVAIKAAGLPDEEEAVLQHALAASLLEQQELQPAERRLSPPAGTFGLRRQRHAAEEEECPLIRAASPVSAAGVVPLLPAELEAAAASGLAAGGGGMGGGGRRLADQWWMGLGRPSDSARKKTVAEQEEKQLQRALEMSRLEHEQQQQQQAAAASGATSAGVAGSTSGMAGNCGLAALGPAAAAQAQEEAELQEAIKLSMLEQGGAWPAQPAAARSAAAAAARPRGEAATAAAAAGARQQPGDEGGCQSILDILREVMPGQLPGAAVGTAGSAAEHAQQQRDSVLGAAEAAAAARAEDEATEPLEMGGGPDGAALEAAGNSACPTAAGPSAPPGPALLPPAPAYLQAQIVEDDDPLLAEAEAEAGGAGGKPAGAAPGAGSAAAAGAAAAAGVGAKDKPPAAQYRLHALVSHRGPAASCGHFTSDIRDPASGVWHRFDDSLASRISQAEACSSEKQRECYLLFYAI